MTIRVRYTTRAKFRDLAVAYGLVFRATTPVLRALLTATIRGTRHIITSHYTDQEPQS